MNITFTFRHMDSSEAIKNYASEKIGRFQRYLRSPLEAVVVASIERHLQCVDVTLVSGKKRYEAKEESADMYASLDLVMDKLDRQLKRDKTAKTARKRATAASRTK